MPFVYSAESIPLFVRDLGMSSSLVLQVPPSCHIPEVWTHDSVSPLKRMLGGLRKR